MGGCGCVWVYVCREEKAAQREMHVLAAKDRKMEELKEVRTYMYLH